MKSLAVIVFALAILTGIAANNPWVQSRLNPDYAYAERQRFAMDAQTDPQFRAEADAALAVGQPRSGILVDVAVAHYCARIKNDRRRYQVMCTPPDCVWCILAGR